MILPIEECVENTTIKNKVTFIVPTYNSPMKTTMLSVLSVLLNATKDGPFEHICVCIAGPDDRTADTSLQDKKQSFLEDVRDLGWKPKDSNEMKSAPVTVTRVWSRLGWAETIDMATPWVHTAGFVVMHDDVFLKDSKWEEELKLNFFSNDKVALAYPNELKEWCLSPSQKPCEFIAHNGLYAFKMPNLQTEFLAVKTKWYAKTNRKLNGYTFPREDDLFEFYLDELDEECIEYYKKYAFDNVPLQTIEPYNYVFQEIGAWLYYQMCQEGLEFRKIDSEIITHLKLGGLGLGNSNEERRRKILSHFNKQILETENKVLDSMYAPVYKKYMGIA